MKIRLGLPIWRRFGWRQSSAFRPDQAKATAPRALGCVVSSIYLASPSPEPPPKRIETKRTSTCCGSVHSWTYIELRPNTTATPGQRLVVDVLSNDNFAVSVIPTIAIMGGGFAAQDAIALEVAKDLLNSLRLKAGEFCDSVIREVGTSALTKQDLKYIARVLIDFLLCSP